METIKKKGIKLYDVPEGSKIKIIDDTVRIPIASLEIKKGDILLFSRIDGMYSTCFNSEKQRVYPAAWTEVEIIEK